MTKVKICGITNLQDACHAVKCGADMLGFNFYPDSKRYVEPTAAAEIVAALGDAPVERVGVFVNAEIADVAKIAEEVGLDTIQLHGEEDDKYVEALRELSGKFVIDALRTSSRSVVAGAVNSLATYVLLDSYAPDHWGGTGVAFDWEIAKEVVTLLPEAVYLAGGLTHENVADAIRTARPYAVDVASGVESSPGKKDPAKVAAFIKAAKEAL